MERASTPPEVAHFAQGERSLEEGDLRDAVDCLELALRLNYRNEHPDSADRGMAHDARKKLGALYPQLADQHRAAGNPRAAERCDQRAAMFAAPVETGAAPMAEVIDPHTGEVIG